MGATVGLALEDMARLAPAGTAAPAQSSLAQMVQAASSYSSCSEFIRCELRPLSSRLRSAGSVEVPVVLQELTRVVQLAIETNAGSEAERAKFMDLARSLSKQMKAISMIHFTGKLAPPAMREFIASRLGCGDSTQLSAAELREAAKDANLCHQLYGKGMAVPGSDEPHLAAGGLFFGSAPDAAVQHVPRGLPRQPMGLGPGPAWAIPPLMDRTNIPPRKRRRGGGERRHCYLCGQRGHVQANCPYRDNNNSNSNGANNGGGGGRAPPRRRSAN